MKQFSINITPSIVISEMLDISEDNTLDILQFPIDNREYICKFLFDTVDISYGASTLYQIYIDICDELDKLSIGLDHDLELSFYPMAIISVFNDQVLVKDIKGDPLVKSNEGSYTFSRNQILECIKDTKRRIESFVLGSER